MKLIPIIMPTIAIALVRFSSCVPSAIIAEIAAEMAPAPWIARPKMIIGRVCEKPAKIDPTAKTDRPASMIGLRPKRSLAMPHGICSTACVRP